MTKSEGKLEKVLPLIEKKGFDGMVVYSNGIANMLHPSYFYYLSGLKPLGPNNALIISKSGNVILIIEPDWDHLRASRVSGIKTVRGSVDFVQDLIHYMRDLNITGSVGLAGHSAMPEAVHKAIKEQAKVESADDIIEEIAKVKTAKEIEHIRKTAKMADEGFKAFLEYARVGIWEYELSAEMEYAMRSAGADDNFNLMSSSQHSYSMHAPTDKRLAPGDIVLGEITPVSEGQFMQLCRTVVLGEPSKLIKDKYDLLMKAFDESLKPIKAGIPASLISINMNKVFIDAGYTEYCYPPYMRARGHGLGVGSVAPGGTIDDKNNSILLKNQVIIVHPNQYLPEIGYLACGETVLVTDSGFERLAETETKLYVKEV